MLPEDFVSDRAGARTIWRMVRAATAREIGPRLYTRNMRDAPEAAVARNLWPIVALLAAGSVVSHRVHRSGCQRPSPFSSASISPSNRVLASCSRRRPSALILPSSPHTTASSRAR